MRALTRTGDGRSGNYGGWAIQTVSTHGEEQCRRTYNWGADDSAAAAGVNYINDGKNHHFLSFLSFLSFPDEQYARRFGLAPELAPLAEFEAGESSQPIIKGRSKVVHRQRAEWKLFPFAISPCVAR